MKIQQIQTQSQRQVYLQAMYLLEMNDSEVYSWLDSVALDNPLLDIETLQNAETRYFQRAEKKDPLAFSDLYEPEHPETFTEHLLSEIEKSGTEGRMREVMEYVVRNLNDKGFLDYPEEEIARDTHTDLSFVNEAVGRVKELSPKGSASKDIRSYLLYLLEEDSLAYRIISEYDELLLSNRLDLIAKELGTDIASVNEARELIGSLPFYPSCGYADAKDTGLIRPDASLKVTDGTLQISFHEHLLKAVATDREVLDLLEKQKDDPTLSSYLSAKRKELKLIRDAIAQRQKTVRLCFEAVLSCQKEHFLYGTPVKEMSMRQIAEEAGVHESTVSRVIADRYLETEDGIVSLRSLFQRRAKQDEEPDEISRNIRMIVESEDKKDPFSDERISEMLEDNEIYLSARAVAYRRQKLGIPNAQLRKIF